MARPESLVSGNCYFTLSYFDDKLRIPRIDTYLYIREDFLDGRRVWLFEEPEAPRDPAEATADDEPDEPMPINAVDEANLRSILDIEGLTAGLRELATLHPLHPVPARPVELATDRELEPIAGAVDRVLDDPECDSVSLAIRFGGGFLSIGRQGDRCGLSVYTYPRRDATEDEKMVALFAGLGLAPVVDYLADLGRTRILKFDLPAERDAVIGMCRRVLTEVYTMRQGDELVCHPMTKDDVLRLRGLREPARGPDT